MTYTIEKVTTLIGARRFGEHVARIGFIRCGRNAMMGITIFPSYIVVV